MERRGLRAAPAAAPDMTRAVRRRERPRERWLLTRKTWKYMADAGRRLVPDGAQNRTEDIPRLEAYFQDLCAKEPRFLLWRKSSYPGAVPKPRKKKRSRGGSVRARSPSEAPPLRPADLHLTHTSGGRFDLAKLRRDFFAPPPVVTAPVPPPPVEDDDESSLVELLRKFLKLEEDQGPSRISGAEELVRVLRRFLARQAAVGAAGGSGGGAPREGDAAAADPSRRTLVDTLSRYYGRSTNRDQIVQELLTDRSLLKRLYHDLRKTKPYRGGRNGGGGFGAGSSPSPYSSARGGLRSRPVALPGLNRDETIRSPPLSPPPLIEVKESSLEDKYVDCGTQTVPIPEEVLVELERAYQRELAERASQTEPTSPTSPPPERRGRRKSSIDQEEGQSDKVMQYQKVMQYLRIARKKSVDGEKADRFKRINYDKNLRNIKSKTPADFDDDAFNKGCQTVETWILNYRDLKFKCVSDCYTSVNVGSPMTSPPSPSSPSGSHSFLSSLLGRRGSGVSGGSAGGMQKSRSSSSVVQSVSKRLWPSRSRSSSRAAATWTPQGSCCWTDGSGRCVRLTDTSLLTLSERERLALQQAALARLQQLSLGTTIKIPDENATAPSTKPKRRAYLKKKAITIGFFDQRGAKDSDKDKGDLSYSSSTEPPVNSVFGVPLAQCVATERALRRQQHGGSRASLASLGGNVERADDVSGSESCDSGEWGWAQLDEAGGGGPKVPALVSACLAHLRRHGLYTLGLFRVSASKKRVRQLREDWERGQEAALDAAVCPHDVATLLKEFLRDLPDPLLCRDLYQAFLNTQKIRNRRLQWEALRLVVQLLPAAHRDTLNALLSFLSQLAAHSEGGHGQPGNKMDAPNLATVFAPNILHKNKPDEAASADQLAERADVINVVRQLIERQAELWTLPAELLHEAYIHLAHTGPQYLDTLLLRRHECAAERLTASACEDPEGERRVWSREEFLHGTAAMGGPDRDVPASRRSEKSYARTRRPRDAASDTSSGSMSSAMTIVTSRVRSSTEECGSSGVVCGPSEPASAGRTDSADSNDDASDYNETLGGSDEDCVITAKLHIPATFRDAPHPGYRPAPPPRRRSIDSAVGSSSTGTTSASAASSPPASPPPAPLRVTLTSAGEVRRPATDIDRLINFGRERNTSDARAVVLRHHDDATSRHRETTRHREHTVRSRDGTLTRQDNRQEGTLYKRGELISSATAPPP